METFLPPKPLVENADFPNQRNRHLSRLNCDAIDGPIIDIVQRFNQLPYCFTLQSCYGHFLYGCQSDTRNTAALPTTHTISTVTYRIAYLAICVENSLRGERLIQTLQQTESLDPDNIQFCCAEWFWKQQVNSYALQVEPDRFKCQDTAVLDYKEALKIERLRIGFFKRLSDLLLDLVGCG